jgi:thiamine transport system substrate-binding protein
MGRQPIQHHHVPHCQARTRRRTRRQASAAVALVLAFGASTLTACGDGTAATAAKVDQLCFAKPSTDEVPTPDLSNAATKASLAGTEVTLVTHDSFAVSDGIFDDFTRATGVKVKVLQSGDAGELVSKAVLTAGAPVGDVLYGIDNTFLCRGLAAGIFSPYEAKALGDVPANLRLDPHRRVTPIDVGDVCVNYSKAAYAKGTAAPTSLDDLTNAAYKGQFVTENPETSSPGFAFLLATIAKYGDGWKDYWSKLRANGVQVTSGWSEAYDDAFKGGKGDRSIVTSYNTSPAAEVVYADPKITEAPTAVMNDGCFRQIEFAGILRGTKHAAAAALLVDYLLSTKFQEDIPLNMFVYPANSKAAIPQEFTDYAAKVTSAYTLDPAKIEANRARWSEEWTQIVLR